ncbi:MAG TPA: 2-phospho-L-lactate transferase [Nitrososphaera sp.]|nr:2-phospho-L-lactate transferase [Nitrososphaera sp.]
MITVLAGGTGSVKLVRGLDKLTKEMTVVSNVGDNIWLHGLYVCPDIDTIVYGLAGILDRRRGWGIKGDSFNCLSQLKRLGAPTWFNLGDLDIGTHLLRTSMLKAGRSLSEITDFIRRRYLVSAKIIPATDTEVTTKIVTPKGTMHLQEFWVKNRGAGKVTGVYYAGADDATPSKGAIDAIRKSDLTIIAPGNPVSSIGAIVAIDGLRKELVRNRHKVVAVSPLIGEKAISGPAAKYMKALGIEISPVGVARYYSEFVGSFSISRSDHSMARRIEELDMKVYETNITMRTGQDEVRLGRYILREVGRSKRA